MTYSNVSFEDAMQGEGTVADTEVGVYNGSGEIAIKHMRLVHVTTSCGQNQYLFRTQANICLSWVKEEDVDCVLKKLGGCCGQKRPGIFVLANASDVRRWTNKGGR